MADSPQRRATIGGIIVVVVVLALGIWVLGALDASQKAQECAERRGTRCAIIDETTLPRTTAPQR